MANSIKRTRTASIAAGVGALGIGVALFAPGFAQAAEAPAQPSTDQTTTAPAENDGQSGDQGQTDDSNKGDDAEKPEPGSVDELLAKLKALGIDTSSVEGSLGNLPAGSLDKVDTSSLSNLLPDAPEDEPTDPEAPGDETPDDQTPATEGTADDATTPKTEAFADAADEGTDQGEQTPEDPESPEAPEKTGVVAQIIEKLKSFGLDTSSLEATLGNVDTSSLDKLFPSADAPEETPGDDAGNGEAPAGDQGGDQGDAQADAPADAPADGAVA